MARRQLLLGTIFKDPFVTQTQSIDFDASAEALRNNTDQAIGIANTWSILMWMKLDNFQASFILHISPLNFQTGDTDNQIIMQVDFGFPRLRINIADQTGTQNSIFWDNQFVVDTWVNFLLVWDGTDITLHTDGVDQGIPDSGPSSPSVTQIDGIRGVSLGNRKSSSFGAIDGNISQCALWRVDVSSAASDLYNGGDPNALDLNSSFGDDYTFAGDLAHWWRVGHEASPNIGKDSSTAGFTPTIDIETDAVGITDADRVEDVPT